MTKWIIAVGVVLALLGVLLWQVLSSGKTTAVAPRRDAAVESPSDDADLRPRDRSDASPRRSDADLANTKPVLIDPTSAEFSSRIDVVIPNQFRARAAKCYSGGGDGDRKLKLNYRLRIVDGMVTATNISVKFSNIDEPALERCMIQAVEDVRYRAEDMPDFHEDGELFIRLRSLKKYKPWEEQVREKERNQIIDEDDAGDAP